MIAACRLKSKQCFYCKKTSHHSSLCAKKFGSPVKNPEKKTTKSYSSLAATDSVIKSDVETKSTLSLAESSLGEVVDNNCAIDSAKHFDYKKEVLSMTAVTSIKNFETNKEATIRILFDTGSRKAFLRTEIAKILGLEVLENQFFSVSGFAQNRGRTVCTPLVSFGLKLLNQNYLTIYANLSQVITRPIQFFPLDIECQNLLKDVQLADPFVNSDKLGQIDLLLGMEYFWEIIDLKPPRNLTKDIKLLSSKLGFLPVGKLFVPSSLNYEQVVVMFLSDIKVPDETNLNLELLWKLEMLGIRESGRIKDDDIAQAEFNKTVKFLPEKGRYQVQFPKRGQYTDLPDNYRLALGRLKSLLRRLRRSGSEQILQLYDGVFKEQLKLGIIEQVKPTAPPDGYIHYIPHHAVVDLERASTKCRVVYDASAKMSTAYKSLNENLYRGPVDLEDLCGLLFRFREGQIALTSDIEKAFLQIIVHPCDRDVTKVCST